MLKAPQIHHKLMPGSMLGSGLRGTWRQEGLEALSLTPLGRSERSRRAAGGGVMMIAASESRAPSTLLHRGLPRGFALRSPLSHTPRRDLFPPIYLADITWGGRESGARGSSVPSPTWLLSGTQIWVRLESNQCSKALSHLSSPRNRLSHRLSHPPPHSHSDRTVASIYGVVTMLNTHRM